MAVDSAGDLYIADSDNDVVEKVTPRGTLSIIAGQVGQEGAPNPASRSLSAGIGGPLVVLACLLR